MRSELHTLSRTLHAQFPVVVPEQCAFEPDPVEW